MHPDELKNFRQRVAQGLVKYAEHKATQAALALAGEVLDFRPRFGWTKERQVQTQMQRLVGYGVGPHDLLARVCEFFAFTNANPKRFRTLREEDHALSRAVLKLARMGRWRPNANLLNYLGGELRDSLGGFAMSFLRRIERDGLERGDLKRQSIDWTESA